MMSSRVNGKPIGIYGYQFNYSRKQHIFFFETFSKSMVDESCADVAEKNNASLNIIANMMQNGVDKSEPLSVCQVLFIYLHLVSTSRSISTLMLVDFWLSADTPLTFSLITVALLLAWFNAWTCNYIHHNVSVEIAYPLPNFNVSTVEVWELVISSHTLLGMWILIHVRIKVNPC